MSERAPTLPPGCAELWIAPAALADRAAEEAVARALLDAADLAEAGAFLDPADRRRALASRALVRLTLAGCCGADPRAFGFRRDANGRPHAERPADTGLAFSAAHTRRVVACAVVRGGEVGADVEEAQPHPDLAELATEVMDDAERASMERLPGASRAERFCAAWTLKEAYLKARGVGLALSPRVAAFGLDERERIELRLREGAADTPHGWRFALLRAGAGHLAAVALRGAPEWRLRLRLVRSFAAAPEPADFPLLAATAGLRVG